MNRWITMARSFNPNAFSKLNEIFCRIMRQLNHFYFLDLSLAQHTHSHIVRQFHRSPTRSNVAHCFCVSSETYKQLTRAVNDEFFHCNHDSQSSSIDEKPQNCNLFSFLFSLQVVAHSMSRAQRRPSSMHWKNSFLATIQTRSSRKSKPNKICRRCAIVYSNRANHFTVAANAVSTRPVCCA